MDDNLTWLKTITEASGVSGFENEIRNLLKDRVGSAAEVYYDRLGSIIFKKQGESQNPKIMLACHMDEIGFMVKHITKEGCLKFTTIGGWWEHVMVGQRVTILSNQGAIPGVIGSKPPHILTPEERKKLMQKKDMFIDVGAASDEEAKQTFGIKPGDPVVPHSEFTVMANKKMLMSKAWDNRAGCAIVADVLRSLQNEKHPNTVFGVGTVQEEVGLRGAKTSASVVDPDVAFAVDVTIAGDTPGITEDQAVSKLGKGVAISIYDSSMIPNPRLRDLVLSVAEEYNVPHQLDFIEGGGTDAGQIHISGQGVPSLVINIPTRYIHSHNSIIHHDDYDSAVRLLVAVIKSLDTDKVHSLIK